MMRRVVKRVYKGNGGYKKPGNNIYIMYIRAHLLRDHWVNTTYYK